MTQEFSPVLLLEAELARPLPNVSLTVAEKTYTSALALVRAFTVPLGFVRLTGPVDANGYASAIWAALCQPIGSFLREHRLPAIATLDAAGLSWMDAPEFVRCRSDRQRNAPSMSVVVTTRERPDCLAETLRSLAAQEYRNYEIIVVDNAPATAATAACVQQLTAEIPHLRYVREDRRGLSWARNAGLEAARGEIVVYTDDDVLADRHWLAALLEGFHAGDHVACVTGLILPRELDTPAQLWCEEHAGFGKGFTRRVFDLERNCPDDPLYPYRVSLFGSGANMAFKREVLRAMGGADPALGAGTLARSAAEFPLLFNVLKHRYQLVYAPAAIVRHSHHREYEQFRRQLYGYGVGFTAFLTKQIIEHPATVLDLLRRLPYGLYFTLSGKSPRHGKKSTAYPRELDRLELLGMLYGPLAYLRSRRQVARMRRQHGDPDHPGSSPRASANREDLRRRKTGLQCRGDR